MGGEGWNTRWGWVQDIKVVCKRQWGVRRGWVRIGLTEHLWRTLP